MSKDDAKSLNNNSSEVFFCSVNPRYCTHQQLRPHFSGSGVVVFSLLLVRACGFVFGFGVLFWVFFDTFPCSLYGKSSQDCKSN